MFENIDISKANGGIINVQNKDTKAFPQDSTSNVRRLDTQTADDVSPKETIEIFSCEFSNISAMNGGIFYNSYSNPNYTVSLSNNNHFSDVHTSAWGAILFTQDANISISENTFSNTSAAIGGSIVYANKTNFDLINFWVDNTLVGGQETNALLPITLAPNTFDIELIIDAPIEKIENYFINDGSYMLIRNISTYSLKNANFSIILKYSNGNYSQILLTIKKNKSKRNKMRVLLFDGD